MYTSQIQASFRLSVGPYSKILDGDALSLTSRLPAAVSFELVIEAVSHTYACCKLARNTHCTVKHEEIAVDPADE
jgi:hypothetical protein